VDQGRFFSLPFNGGLPLNLAERFLRLVPDVQEKRRIRMTSINRFDGCFNGVTAWVQEKARAEVKIEITHDHRFDGPCRHDDVGCFTVDPHDDLAWRDFLRTPQNTQLELADE